MINFATFQADFDLLEQETAYRQATMYGGGGNSHPLDGSGVYLSYASLNLNNGNGTS